MSPVRLLAEPQLLLIERAITRFRGFDQ